MTNSVLPANSPNDADRRLWLGAATDTGGARLVATAAPFDASLSLNEKARALVDVDLGNLRPGELHTVECHGKPVFVWHHTPEMIGALARHDSPLADPQSRRSEQPDLGVIGTVCTHLGCAPSLRPTPDSEDIGAQWPGRYYRPRHSSKLDLAGRVFKNMPTPTNLTVPPYHFVSETALLIGADPTT